MNTLTLYRKGFALPRLVDKKFAQEEIVPLLMRQEELMNGPIETLHMYPPDEYPQDNPLTYTEEGMPIICEFLSGRVSHVKHANLSPCQAPGTVVRLSETELRAFAIVNTLLVQSHALESIIIPLTLDVIGALTGVLSLPTLRKVHFQKGRAGATCFGRMHEIMCVRGNLEELHVEYVFMEGPDSSLQLGLCLRELPNLRSFVFYDTGVKLEETIRLLEGLRDSSGTSLEKLSLGGCNFYGNPYCHRDLALSQRVEQLLEEILSRHSRLTSLGFSGCGIERESNALRSIAQGVSASGARLTELTITAERGSLNQIISLLEMVVNSLQVLNLCCTGIGDAGDAAFDRFTDISSQLKHLRVLNLEQCYMQNEPAVGLARGLTNLAHLEELRFASNSIGAVGVEALLRAVPNVQVLDLKRNLIGDDGAEALASHSANLQHLRVLKLHCCEIAEDGARSIARLVNDLPCLEVLDMSANPSIGIDGVTALADSIARHQTLRDLNLYGLGNDDNFVRSLTNMLRRTPSLTSLRLGANFFVTVEACRVLEAILRDYQDQGQGQRSIPPNFTLSSLRVPNAAWQRRFDFYCQLNAAGRGSFLATETGTEDWLRGVQQMDAEAGLSGIFHAIRSNPEAVPHESYTPDALIRSSSGTPALRSALDPFGTGQAVDLDSLSNDDFSVYLFASLFVDRSIPNELRVASLVDRRFPGRGLWSLVQSQLGTVSSTPGGPNSSSAESGSVPGAV